MANDPLINALRPHGLMRLGEAPFEEGAVALIGPDEPRFWEVFVASPEMQDGAADPLDRWSRRVMEDVAAEVGGEPLYPFGGPPWHPFHSWAVASGRAWASPIGFLVHETAGLFVSFRGALRLDRPPVIRETEKPCETCAAPCRGACPVGAFAGGGYDVAACKAHVMSPEGQDCRAGGCLARRACPVGQGRRLAAQSAFHMEAFL